MKILRLVLLVTSILCLALVVTARTVDGPIYVVGAGNTSTAHVFPTLTDALAAIGAAGAEATGATIVLYPGTHAVANPLNINIPQLTITSLEGADRTQLVPTNAGAVFNIASPGVVIEDLQIVGGTNTTGVVVAARDCVLRDLIISNHRGAAPDGMGIRVNAGADGLQIVGCDLFANEVDGVNATAALLWDLAIANTTIRSNGAAGISLTNALGASITDCTITGNGTGVSLGNTRDITITSCSINSSTGVGIAVTNSTRIRISACTFIGNAANAVLLDGAGSCSVANNVFDQNNGGAVAIVGAVPSTLNTIEHNVITLQAGPLAVTAPVPAILLGPAQACTVRENSISGYTWGIVLLGRPPLPQGNSIADNTIQRTLGAGIQVNASGGDNRFLANTVTNCGGNGIQIRAGVNDLYDGNTVTRNTLSGIDITAPAAGAVAIDNLVVSKNTVSGNGVSGITVDSTNLPGVTNLVIRENSVMENDGPGIRVTGNALASGLRVLSNEIANNEAEGVIASLCPGARISYNRIHGNRSEGLQAQTSASAPIDLEISWNSVFENTGGGLNLGLAGLLTVVESNFVYSNLGFGVQLQNLPVLGALPYPQGFSLGSNWWGVSVGPSGFFAGTGNAVLGLPANRSLALAPILSAPPATSERVDAELILEPAQVSVLTSFAAGTVTVDRTDTTGFKITFSGVSARSNGWVSLARFTPFATSGEPWSQLGNVVKSASVLVSGLSNGMAQIVCEFGDLQNSGNLKLYAYKGGGWAVNEDTGDWKLSGGSWVELAGCVTVGSQVVYGEIPVTELLGDVKAIALASSDASGTE